MKQDWLGNPVTASSDATISGINDFSEGFLGYENKAANILKASEEDPDNCLANAYSALFYMFLENNDAAGLARPYVEKAESAAAKASRREQMTTAIARAWVDGDVERAIKLSHQVADEYPRDLAIVKQAQYHYFNLGNCDGMLSIGEQVLDRNSDVAYAHGLVAFGYEQCNRMQEAEDAARKAIEMKRKEPWAHHALAHVLLTQGRINEGVDFLTDVSETWVDLNSFMVTHNWWHLGLNYISQGRFEDTLKLYDNHVWGVWKEYSQDQINAVSMLMRLEIVGVDVGNRWEDIGTYLKPRVSDFVQPFLTTQYLYGLARAGLPEADTLMENLKCFVATAPIITRKAWREVAMAACEGLIAHAREEYELAYRKMKPIVPRLLEIGGSHAQRDLFRQVLMHSMIKTGRNEEAIKMLEKARAFEPDSIPLNSALVQIYSDSDLPQEAAQAQARLAQTI